MSSSSYDVAAILAALDNFSTRAERVPNNRAVRDYLLNKGISDAIANPLSKNEFCYWRQEELDEVFNSLRVTSSEVTSGLLSFTIQGDPNDPSLLIKPTFEEIEQSARALGALCVNRNGEFCVNPDAGYAALSHVWSQGMGADDENRGLHKSLLDQVFALVEPLGIRWIWTDSLAIPGGKRALNVAEEEVKAILINAMADIYRNAKTVIVFDALCLRLDSIDPEKTAAVLACGSEYFRNRFWGGFILIILKQPGLPGSGPTRKSSSLQMPSSLRKLGSSDSPTWLVILNAKQDPKSERTTWWMLLENTLVFARRFDAYGSTGTMSSHCLTSP